MKNLLIAIILLCSLTDTKAQSESLISKMYINGYASSFKPFNYYTYMGFNTRSNIRDYISPSFGLSFSRKGKNYHEIELSRFDISKQDIKIETYDYNGNKYYQPVQMLTNTFIALRYEYILGFIKKKNAILKPQLGFSAMPYYYRNKSTPYLSYDYPVAQTYVGIQCAIVPRINISLSSKLLLDINIPLPLLETNIAKQNIANPKLPAQSQKYSIVDVMVFPRYFTARVGLGLKI
ncbi:MAG: hypothetical protein JST82_15930 [Bacteroidetes bacterium]|nr:hypothetical protein [Bacteroidota bacterium]